MSDERSTTAVDKRIGQRVRFRRLEVGISQERLAEALGVTFQQVQKYEKGVNRIAASRLWEISGVLKAPIGYFFDAKHIGGAAAAADGPGLLDTAEGTQLAVMFSDMAPAGRDLLLAIARVIAAHFAKGVRR